MPAQARTPVTVITGDYFIDDGAVAALEGMGARLSFKPLWEEDLLRIVRDATGR